MTGLTTIAAIPRAAGAMAALRAEEHALPEVETGGFVIVGRVRIGDTIICGEVGPRLSTPIVMNFKVGDVASPEFQRLVQAMRRAQRYGGAL